MVRQIGVRHATRCAGRIPLRHPLRVLPPERREVNDARVEPGVADLLDPRHLCAAVLAADRHLVDPGPVQLLELVEPRDRALVELGARADHVQPSAVAGIERQRQPEVTPPRDVPVAHVAQPVVHPLLVLGGLPGDLVVAVQHQLPDLGGRDEPVVHDAENERRAAAPADGIAVADRPRLDEQLVLVQPFQHRLGDRIRGAALELAVARQEAPRLVDRRQHREPVNA